MKRPEPTIDWVTEKYAEVFHFAPMANLDCVSSPNSRLKWKPATISRNKEETFPWVVTTQPTVSVGGRRYHYFETDQEARDYVIKWYKRTFRFKE